MRIKESIVVEGRDDTAAVKRAVDAQTIETHGFGIKSETWKLIEKAYHTTGIIIFTDPDYSGEEIRRKIWSRFPDAKQAYLSKQDATKAGDIGVENAEASAIQEALQKARCIQAHGTDIFSMEDLNAYGLSGGDGAAERREKLGKALGIGYGNSKAFLNKLNQYHITKEELEAHLN